MLVLLPPWGRSLTERAVVSGVVLLGVVAIVFPRAGSMPVTSTSVRLFLSAAGAGRPRPAAGAAPARRADPAPDPERRHRRAARGGQRLLAHVGVHRPIDDRDRQRPVLQRLGQPRALHHVRQHVRVGEHDVADRSTGRSPGTSGTRRCTRRSGRSPSWRRTRCRRCSTGRRCCGRTCSGARSPSPCASSPSPGWPATSRPASAVGTARRGRGRWRSAAMALFGLLGSPALLFNAGFTNFMMGVTVVVVVGLRRAPAASRSARTLGWFIVPLGAMAVIGLWTPLVLGLVPTGVVVAIALLKHNRWLGIAWLVAAAAIAAFMVPDAAARPSSASSRGSRRATSPPTSVRSAPAWCPSTSAWRWRPRSIAILVIVLLVRAGQWPLAVAVAGPILGAAAVAAYFATGSDAAGISRLQSYYVLKPLDAALLATAVAGRGARRGRGGARGRRAAARLGRHRDRPGGRDPRRLLRLRRRPALARPRTASPRRRASRRVPTARAASRTRSSARPSSAGSRQPCRTPTTPRCCGTAPAPCPTSGWRRCTACCRSRQQRFYRDLPSFPYDAKTLGLRRPRPEPQPGPAAGRAVVPAVVGRAHRRLRRRARGRTRHQRARRHAAEPACARSARREPRGRARGRGRRAGGPRRGHA